MDHSTSNQQSGLQTRIEAGEVIQVHEFFDFLKNETDELKTRFKNMTKWVQWVGSLFVMIVGAVLGYLLANDAALSATMQAHKDVPDIHRTTREIQEHDKLEAQFRETVKEEMKEIKRLLNRRDR